MNTTEGGETVNTDEPITSPEWAEELAMWAAAAVAIASLCCVVAQIVYG